jgi:hypothetical protein
LKSKRSGKGIEKIKRSGNEKFGNPEQESRKKPPCNKTVRADDEMKEKEPIWFIVFLIFWIGLFAVHFFNKGAWVFPTGGFSISTFWRPGGSSRSLSPYTLFTGIPGSGIGPARKARRAMARISAGAKPFAMWTLTGRLATQPSQKSYQRRPRVANEGQASPPPVFLILG